MFVNIVHVLCFHIVSLFLVDAFKQIRICFVFNFSCKIKFVFIIIVIITKVSRLYVVHECTTQAGQLYLVMYSIELNWELN